MGALTNMNIQKAKELLNQAFENLQSIQDELEVDFPEELTPETTEDKFFDQLRAAIDNVENCAYDLDQID